MIILGIASIILAGFGISQEQLSPRERAERRAADIQQRSEAIFGGKLPPGAATVIGRAAIHSSREGFTNSVTLLEAAKDTNIQKELGLSAAQVSQMQSARTDMQLQAMMLAPKYINRFKTMTDADHDAIQEELQQEIEAVCMVNASNGSLW